MNKKLSIAILDLDDIRNPLLGAGQAKTTFEVAKRLAAKGHTVSIYCSRYPNYKDRQENGIFYKHVSLGTNNIRLNNIFYILSMPFVVPFIKADVILECFTAPISTMFTPLFTKIPVIGLSVSFEAERFAKLYHFPLQPIEKFGAKFYRYFIAFTKSLEEKMKHYNPQVITELIPHGVDHAYLTIKQTKPSFLLYLGRLDMSQKGIDMLLDAYSKYETEITLPLHIAGRGPDKDKILTRIKELQLTKHVTLIGNLDEKEKQQAFTQAAAVIIPSRQESFCLVALEALASGLPVLTFAIPGLSWIQSGLSKTVAQFDIDNFGKELVNLSTQLDNKTKKQARKNFAKQFTWDIVTNKYETFCQNVIQKSI